MKFLAVMVLTLMLVCTTLSLPQGDKDCPKFCTSNYDPVCGFDGNCHRQFSNDCALSGAVCNSQTIFKQVPLEDCSKTGVKHCSF